MSDVIASPRHSLWRLVVDRNPFYLLSALCMLFGCIALTNSSSFSPIRINRLIILITTLNFYELLLIGLALFLFRRGLWRDGTILLIFEAFFLVDVTFLNAEIFSTNLRIGLLVNVILVVFALTKIAAIFRGLGVPVRSAAFLVTMIELAALFALPGVLKRIASAHDGAVPALAIYAAWWVAALLPILAVMAKRAKRFGQRGGVVGLFMILPIVSLLAHVCTSNWVYKVSWYSANLSPIVLSLAITIGAFDAHVTTLGKRMKAHFLLPLGAIALSVQFPFPLIFHSGPVVFSPLRCTLLGAMLVYVAGFAIYRHILFAWAACACGGSAIVGMSVSQILNVLNLGAKRSWSISQRFWPNSTEQWGIVSLASSFVLLVLGAFQSLRNAARFQRME